MSCNSTIYVSDLVTGYFFLSYKTMVELLIIKRGLLTISSQLPHHHSKVAKLNDKKNHQTTAHAFSSLGFHPEQKSLTLSASSRDSARSVTSILSRGTGLLNLKMPVTPTMQSMR